MTALDLPSADDPAAVDQVSELLPWFAAGTLAPTERKFVQDWLARHGDLHPELIAELAWLRRTATQTREIARVSPKLAQAGLNELMLRIARDAGRQVPAAAKAKPGGGGNGMGMGKRRVGLLGRLGQGLANLFTPRPILVFGLLAVMLVQVGVIGKLMLREPAAEQTPLGGETGSPIKPIAVAGELVVFTVAFRANARESEIRDVLQAAGAQLIGGPSALGLYRLAVPIVKAEAAQAVLRGSMPNVVDSVKKDE